MSEEKSRYGFIGGIIKVSILFGVAVGIIVWQFTKSGGDKLVKEWEQHRDNPLLMPFAGLFGKSASGNQHGVIYNLFHKFFGVLMKPIQYVMSLVKKNLGGLSGSLNIFRALMKPIRTFIANAVKGFYEKLSNILSAIIYFFLKIRDLLRRLASTFRLSLYLLQAMQFTMQSVWDGPIGSVARDWGYTFGKIVSFFGHLGVEGFMCLSGDTPIRMANGGVKPVSTLRLGERIATPKGPTCVVGMAHTSGRYKTTPTPLYRVGDALLTGDHLVYVRQGKQTLVERAQDIGELEVHGQTTLFCPLTGNHLIQTAGGQVLADFEESTDPQLEAELLQDSLHTLSYRMDTMTTMKNTYTLDTPPTGASPGLTGECYVETVMGPKRIDSLEIGARLVSPLTGENRVLGILVSLPQEAHLYHYQGFRGSSRQIVWTGQAWRPLSALVSAKKTAIGGLVDTRLYSLFTTQGVYRVHGTWVTDISDGLPTEDIERQEGKIRSALSRHPGIAVPSTA